MNNPVTVVDPSVVTFERWAADLTEQLSSYNAPSPGAEDEWRPWAEQISAIPVIAELGVQDPRYFRSWQDWARALLQVLP